MPVKEIKRQKFARPKYVDYHDLRSGATERSNFSGRYFRPLLKNIVDISKERGVDPYEMLGLALQETKFGQDILHRGRTGDVFNVQGVNNPGIKYTADFLKEKERLAKARYGTPTRAQVLQGWQGYGKLKGNYFGVKDPDLGEVPLHGLRVLEHIESLRKNPGITKLLMEP